MYSDAVKLHEMMNIRIFQGSFDTAGMFYLMRGDLSRRRERMWIRVDAKKEYDWDVNPEECSLFLFIDEEKPVIILEKPPLERREDGSWYFDAVKWLAEKKIGYTYHMIWKKAYRETGSLERAFWAGTQGKTTYQAPYPGAISASHKLKTNVPFGSLSVCGRSAKSMSAELFTKEPVLDFSWARKMCGAVEVPQNITSADLTGSEAEKYFSSLELTSVDGLRVWMSMLSVSAFRGKRRWHLVFDNDQGKKAGLDLMLKFWCAETDEERDLIQQQAEADGLGHCDMMEEKKETELDVTPEKRDFDRYDRFVLNCVMTMKGRLYLLAHSHDLQAKGARILLREGKKEKVMQMMFNPKDCLWCYVPEGIGIGDAGCIIEPVEDTHLEDGNLLLEPGKWLDAHGIPWTLRPHKECAGFWNYPVRCWHWYRY